MDAQPAMIKESTSAAPEFWGDDFAGDPGETPTTEMAAIDEIRTEASPAQPRRQRQPLRSVTWYAAHMAIGAIAALISTVGHVGVGLMMLALAIGAFAAEVLVRAQRDHWAALDTTQPMSRVLARSMRVAASLMIVGGLAGGVGGVLYESWARPASAVTTLTGRFISDTIALHGDNEGLAFSPNGTALALGTADGVEVAAVANGAVEHHLVAPAPTHATGIVTTLAWSPGGGDLAGLYHYHIGDAAPTDELVVWRLDHDAVLYSAPAFGEIHQLSWSPDGTRVSGYLPASDSATLATILIWNVPARSLSQPIFLPGLPDAVPGEPLLSWSPDSHTIATTNGRAVLVFDVASGMLAQRFDDTQPVVGVAWSPDGASFATVRADGSIGVWNATSEQLAGVVRQTAGAGVVRVLWSPDGSRLLCATAMRVFIFVAATVRPLTTLVIGGAGALTIAALAWSPDSSRIGALLDDGRIITWQVG